MLSLRLLPLPPRRTLFAAMLLLMVLCALTAHVAADELEFGELSRRKSKPKGAGQNQNQSSAAPRILPAYAADQSLYAVPPVIVNLLLGLLSVVFAGLMV